MQATTPARTSDDACPGALRPHHAADGELLRVRVPGGALTPTALRALGAASREWGDGRIGLTSRGNVQVRAVAADDVDRVGGRLREAGLIPAPEHERVRNILASPMSGRGPAAGPGRRRGIRADVDPLVRELDEALCARPELAQLPGRFLFALDDGTGDVAGEAADVLAVPMGEGAQAGGASAGIWRVQLPGATWSLRVRRDQVVETLLAVAAAFLREREAQGSRAWRIRELDGGPTAVANRMRDDAAPDPGVVDSGSTDPGAADDGPVDDKPADGGAADDGPADGGPADGGPVDSRPLAPGLIEQNDGRFAVCALIPLGLLEPDQLEALAAAAELSEAPVDQQLRITPWRRVVVRDLSLPRALAVRELLRAVGLVTQAGSAWSRVTACAGRPGCAKALTDVHSDARAFVETQDRGVGGPLVHWAGCERGCGTPSGPSVVRMLATAGGYRAERGTGR
jgi:precorrin-3B synthase